MLIIRVSFLLPGIPRQKKFKYGDGTNRSALPNTRTLHFTTWQLQIPDVTFTETQDPLPTCKFYWAGFFNSVDELTDFAAAN